MAIQGRTQDNGIAHRYKNREILPFRSLPIALASFDVAPLQRMMVCCNSSYETAARARTAP
jgi:hypothetical protein